MITKLITAPDIEPVSLADVKVQSRIYNTDSDTLLQSLLDSAIAQAENITGRAVMTQTWAVIFESWAEMTACVLPFGQLQSVTSVKYNDEDGESQTVSTDDYLVGGIGTDEGRIIIYSDSDFDYPDLYEKDPITVTFVCGYTADKVPDTIKTAVKLLVESVFYDIDTADAVTAHLNPHRIWTV